MSIGLLVAKPAQAATITVNTNADDLTANGNCILREAITAANTNAAVDACTSGTAGADTINFAIPGAGPHTISPTSDLPAITETVTINGYSESLGEGTPASPNFNADLAQGTNANLLIELDGRSIAGSNGLIQINASDVVVKGLVLKCYNTGIFIAGTLNSTPEKSFIIQFFSSSTGPPLGKGEGKRFLGQKIVTTNQRGIASFTFNKRLRPGETVVSATATSNSTGDTSEFSIGVIAS